MSTNPFEAPAYNPDVASESTDGEVLAGRFTRFAAAMVDGLIMMAISLPIQFGTGYIQRAQLGKAAPLEQIAMSLLGAFVMLLFSGYFLANRGQSIGKIATGIQIIDASSGSLLSFFRVFVLRYLWSVPLSFLVVLIPGTNDDIIVGFIIGVGVLLIFGSERRCLHDYIAGSRVVMFKPDRKKMI